MNARALPDFTASTVAVVGDLICDRYLMAEPRKLSREAPVMVLRHVSERAGAGGAANVARNLRALGARVVLLGAVGRDADGRDLLHLLEQDGVDVAGVQSVPGWTTPTKTRVLAAEPRRSLQQVLRIDREPEAPIPAAVRRELVSSALELAGNVDALIVSDYDYGAVDVELGHAAAKLARGGLSCVLDPRGEIEAFAGITAITPNIGELARFTGRHELDRLEEPAALAEAARELRLRAGARYLLVTRGNLGMALFGEGLEESGVAVEASGQGDVTDVSGAGDTATAVFTLACAAGMTAPDAMTLANAASGVVVMENGAAVCGRRELSEALANAPRPVRLSRAGAL
jgi:rfaE bifunctional protein kinase chain/domain